VLKAWKDRSIFDLIEYFCSILIAFFMLVDQKIVTYLIAALGLNAIVSGFVRGAVKPQRYQLFFPALFVFYLFGLIFTENFEYGGKDIETRLSFFLFPIIYATFKREKPINLSILIWSFVLGAFIYLGISLKVASECMEIERTRFCYESYQLSRWIHPTYAAIYLIVGSGFVLADAFYKNVHLWKKIVAPIVTVVFYYFVYKFYSLGPWISFGGMLITVGFAIFYFRKKVYLFFIGATIFGVIGFMAVQNLDLLASDYNAVKKELGTYFKNKEAYIEANKNSPGSVNARLLIWNVSFEVIAEHPFGVGTGDGKDVLMDYYQNKGMNAFAERKLNQHCQYLQTAGAIGIFPALFLIFAMIYLTVKGFRHKNYFLLILVSTFATGCLFESILERQWGIIFFLFFLSIILTNLGADKAKSESITQ
jgi:hypothetical protein